jgi:hypothetical protein
VPLRELHGRADGSRQLSPLCVEGDVLEKRPRVLLVSLYSNLSQRLIDVVFLCCVPPGRSCILSSTECSLSSDLVGRLEPEDI